MRNCGPIVLREIESRPDIRSHDINVKVLGNTVMLTGFVHTFAEKGSAEKCSEVNLRSRLYCQ